MRMVRQMPAPGQGRVPMTGGGTCRRRGGGAGAEDGDMQPGKVRHRAADRGMVAGRVAYTGPAFGEAEFMAHNLLRYRDTTSALPSVTKNDDAPTWLLATFGDSGSLRRDGPSQVKESHLENPGKSRGKRATVWPSASPSPGIHQQRPRARFNVQNLKSRPLFRR